MSPRPYPKQRQDDDFFLTLHLLNVLLKTRCIYFKESVCTTYCFVSGTHLFNGKRCFALLDF